MVATKTRHVTTVYTVSDELLGDYGLHHGRAIGCSYPCDDPAAVPEISPVGAVDGAAHT